MKFFQLTYTALAITLLFSCSSNEFDRGNELYAEKNFEAAIVSYSNYIDTHPKDAPIYFNRGRALEEQGQLEKAKKDYRMAAKLDPYNSDYRMGSGMCNFRLANYNQAIIDMNEVLKLDTRSAEAFYVKGIALIKKGDVRGAMESYDSALRYNANHAGAYFQRGVLKALAKKGNPCQDLKKAKSLGEKKANSAIKKYCK